MNKNILIYALAGVLLLFAFMNMSFKKSYRYVIYQSYIAFKNKDVRYVDKYFDFDKITDGIAQIVFPNDPSFDKERFAKELRFKMENIYIAGNPYFDKISPLKLYLYSFFNMGIDGKPLNLKVEGKDMVSITFQTPEDENMMHKDVYQKVNNQWKLVGLYIIPKN